MTLGDPDHSQKSACYDPVFLDGLAGICRARGVETAGRKHQGRNNLLIDPYQYDRDVSYSIS